jgi:hypothetical protein
VRAVGIAKEPRMTNKSETNPNDKEPGEKRPGKYHYNPGNMSGKKAEKTAETTKESEPVHNSDEDAGQHKS